MSFSIAYQQQYRVGELPKWVLSEENSHNGRVDTPDRSRDHLPRRLDTLRCGLGRDRGCAEGRNGGNAMIISAAFLLSLGVAALASALKVLIGGPWSWREFLSWTAYTAVVLLVLLTGGAFRIG